MTLKKTLMAVCGLAVMAFGTSSHAADVTLKLGVVTPTDHPHSTSAREFARLVKEKTDGAVEISVFDNGSLGSNPELLDAVSTGLIDFTISTPGVMAEYAPVTGILELPYVFADKQHMMNVTRGDIGKEIATTYKDASGIEILGYMGGAQRNMITTKAKINGIGDLSGLKMRTWEWDVMLNWWKGLGALGTVIAFPEVYTALQTGVVDGAENEFSTFTTARWAEVAKNVSLTQHSITVRPLVGNAGKLAGMSEEHQYAIREAALEAADFDVELEGKLDDENMAKLKSDYGVVFTTPDKGPMIEASAAVIQNFASEKGLEALAGAISEAK
ncbi:TRAP transporter substrate-binding protein [Roseibium aggregatum]|uniref:TRAP transporter substrate-binding protein n=1 Tax=Roseibium aggregatum TaxID=187304 RepID=UPI0025AC51E1|nr:TRAP transporter substrate-binding protein [Roseibium aggregatum]WJS05626.1 TRAP transporter substrate-binding protein [Roseibium aggregatum]